MRSFRLADVAVRVIAPDALDSAKLPELASQLRALAPITDAATARAARDGARSVRASIAYADDTYRPVAAAAADAARHAAYAATCAADAADASADAAAYAAAHAATYAVADADASAAADAVAAYTAAYTADAATDAIAAAAGHDVWRSHVDALLVAAGLADEKGA